MLDKGWAALYQGTGFSPYITAPNPMRLQPLREGMRRNRRTDQMKRTLLQILPLLVCLLLTPPLHAHIGSPDVYEQGSAGPYRLFIVVRPPQVIPGVADIEVRSETPGIDRIDITPIPLTGEASKHPPVPDSMKFWFVASRKVLTDVLS